jgi:deoxyribodipyrimidine photo-lyase
MDLNAELGGRTAERSVVWFRQDLRLGDNPALAAELAKGQAIPLYIFDETARPPLGGASRWWLHHSLDSFDRDIRNLGSRLILRRGDPLELIPRFLAEAGSVGVYFNRCYEPHAFGRDKALKRILTDSSLGFYSFNGSLLFEPWSVKTKEGNPFRVFTPFWKTCRLLASPHGPLPRPTGLSPVPDEVRSDKLEDWGLLPTKPDWAGGLRATRRVGETGACEQLESFLGDRIARYAKGRDFPDAPWTSRLSPHLHWGEVSPRQIRDAVANALAEGKVPQADSDKFLAELGWREFSYHLLFYNPTLPDEPLQPKFRDFPWGRDPALLAAWRRGVTGYPIVDA